MQIHTWSCASIIVPFNFQLVVVNGYGILVEGFNAKFVLDNFPPDGLAPETNIAKASLTDKFTQNHYILLSQAKSNNKLALVGTQSNSIIQHHKLASPNVI